MAWLSCGGLGWTEPRSVTDKHMEGSVHGGTLHGWFIVENPSINGGFRGTPHYIERFYVGHDKLNADCGFCHEKMYVDIDSP